MAALLLSLLSAATALAAAIYWFLSASNRLPNMVSYWDGVPEDDPFFVAMQKGVTLNRRAAGFAAVSALSSGLATLASLKPPTP